MGKRVGRKRGANKMKAITSTSRPRRQERILDQEAGGTTVLLSLEAGQYYSLNAVGGRAWALCDGSRKVSEIAGVLGGQFDASTETIERDLLELFNDLAHENLVVESPEPSGGA